MVVLLVLLACAGSTVRGPGRGGDSPSASTADPRADVVAARATGDDGALTVHVTIRSDETGCGLYADWWELVLPDGTLVGRRILAHSHPTDNPFERSLADVALDRDTEVIVRAHLAPGGYVGDALRGTFGEGWTVAELPAGWAAALETAPPQPDPCLY